MNKSRIGEIKFNNFGTKMKIIEYYNSTNITIEFQDEYKYVKYNIEYSNFKKGNVSNPYDKTVYDVGYYGVGKYKAKIGKKITKEYDFWRGMIKRCYEPYTINKQPAYKDCFVCKEWHNFQNFAKWWEENVYDCNNERMHLDKDILCKGNKIYSPETCVFVPERINILFTKSDKARGKYPIGICLTSDNSALRVRCSVLKDKKKKNIYLGCFPLDKPFQAFYCYKQFKENYIKQVADEYKDLIPKKLYDAMYEYEVEITD